MQYITTTQLRTESKKLVKTLKSGGTFRLIHRSQVVGEIIPTYEPKPFDAKSFKQFVDKLNLPKTTYAERERRYRAHLMKKYGKGLPRH